jgi:hypothetical protein
MYGGAACSPNMDDMSIFQINVVKKGPITQINIYTLGLGVIT